jgi:hypothetical protein
LIEWLLVPVMVIIIAAVLWGAHIDSQRPSIMLKKKDWRCTQYKTRMRPQQMGKVLIMIPTEVCVEYRRIGD